MSRIEIMNENILSYLFTKSVVMFRMLGNEMFPNYF